MDEYFKAYYQKTHGRALARWVGIVFGLATVFIILQMFEQVSP